MDRFPKQAMTAQNPLVRSRTLRSAAKFGLGWGVIGVAVLPILALRGSAPEAAVVIQVIVGALGVGLAAYWATANIQSSESRVGSFQTTACWVVAFMIASSWFWLAPKSQTNFEFISSGGQNAQSFDEPTTSFERKRSVLIGPSNLVGAEVVFGLVGGLLTTLLSGGTPSRLAENAVVSAIAWGVGAAVGGYLAFVGSYFLALIGAFVLRPLPTAGAAIGFGAAGWLGGLISALIGMSAQRAIQSKHRES